MSEPDLDMTLSALADPIRRDILRQLARSDAGVLELASRYPVTQPAITKHLKVLERAGLISRGREAQRRPCRLQPKRVAQLSDWMGSYREFLEGSFERLDEYLQEVSPKEGIP